MSKYLSMWIENHVRGEIVDLIGYLFIHGVHSLFSCFPLN